MKTAEQITPTTRIIASEKAIGCDVEGEMVLLDLESGTYFGLNTVGADIWAFISEARSVEEIERHLLSRYNVSYEQCQMEVQDLLIRCAEKGLIRRQ